jgi:2-polyprenyl-3-methyl-5-hydroxy-6-metoxy-1,4-benzoquinol methylase
VSSTGLSNPHAKALATSAELPQPLHLFELLTGSRHYHLGYFRDDPAESMATAMSCLSRECLSLLAPGRKVLDVGCALGGTAMALGAAGFKVVGIDPCATAIAYAQESAYAQENVAGTGPAHVRFQRASLERFARHRSEHGSYTGIVMIEVLQHFPRLVEALRCCRALLVPGGTLVVSDIAKLPDLRWSRVPFHRHNHLVRVARDVDLEVLERRDVTAHVMPTMSKMAAVLQGSSGWITDQLAPTRPDIHKDLDELVVQLQHLDIGFANSDLTYEMTVLRRPRRRPWR